MNSSLALGWLRGGLLLTQVKHELASGLLLALPSLPHPGLARPGLLFC